MGDNKNEISIDDVLASISPKFKKASLQKFISDTFKLTDVLIHSDVTVGEKSKKGDSYLSTVNRFTIRATGKNARYVYVFFCICNRGSCN